ncbi:MAG: hypothetical protein CMN76_18535 [Spirochaetaceae bacterium]|nr:hypothetical protein [Spirochaetaceae bacterium]|tara:strand:- start:299501 stop:299971 length:471 start_codon:yes stop_codon:yes gene_type:complete
MNSKPDNTETDQMVMDGHVHLDYQWNPGSVIGAFLTGLREGEIRAGKCESTGKLFLPPQSRSPFGGRCKEIIKVETPPELRTGTVVHRPPWNVPAGLKPPYMLASISFSGVETELIHLVVGSLSLLRGLQPGHPLKPVWAEQTEGSIRDILYFQPE